MVLEFASKIGVVSLGATPEQRVQKAQAEQAAMAAHEARRGNSSLRNQKYGVLCGLLELSAWDAAKALGMRLRGVGADPFGDPDPVAVQSHRSHAR